MFGPQPGSPSGTRRTRLTRPTATSNETSRPCTPGCAPTTSPRRGRGGAAWSDRPSPRAARSRSGLRLDLDEDEFPALADDQVELAAGEPDVASQDAVGAQAVVPERAPLSSPPDPRLANVHVAQRLERQAMDVGRPARADGRRVTRRDVADVRREAVVRKQRVHPAHRAVADDLGDDRRGCDRRALRVAVDERPMVGRRRASRKPSTRQTSAGGASAASAWRSPARLERWRPFVSISRAQKIRTEIFDAHPTTA